jgi:ketosteroid isomerase-like protein
MSQENVEIVKGIYAEWEKGNFRAALPVLDREITFETWMPDSNDEIVTLHGLERLDDFMRDWFGQWEDYRVTGDEFRAVGTDHVFVAGRQAGVGRTSGAAVDSPGFTVWTFRAGKVVRLLAHYDRNAALEAAGLSD